MPVVDPRIAGKPVPRISKEAMERDNVARARTVKGSDLAFLDRAFPPMSARSSTWWAWASPRTRRSSPT
jgi:hypothetical protein